MSRIFQALSRYFLVGVFAVLPLVVTVGVVIWVTDFVSKALGPGTVVGRMLETLGLRFAHSRPFAYAVGWLIVLLAIFGLGVLLETGARRFLHDRVDSLAQRIPVLGGIYGTVRQFVGMLDTKGKGDLKGMSVVYCFFGSESGLVLLALMPTPELFRIGDVDYHAVIIPTAPVPVGGGLFFVPANSIRAANLTVDALMSIYVSMGVTGPQFLEVTPGRKTLDRAPTSDQP